MTDKKKTEELSEQELNEVNGGFSFGVEREMVVKPNKESLSSSHSGGVKNTKGFEKSGGGSDI